jgi:hypothetical protein
MVPVIPAKLIDDDTFRKIGLEHFSSTPPTIIPSSDPLAELNAVEIPMVPVPRSSCLIVHMGGKMHNEYEESSDSNVASASMKNGYTDRTWWGTTPRRNSRWFLEQVRMLCSSYNFGGSFRTIDDVRKACMIANSAYRFFNIDNQAMTLMLNSLLSILEDNSATKSTYSYNKKRYDAIASGRGWSTYSKYMDTFIENNFSDSLKNDVLDKRKAMGL